MRDKVLKLMRPSSEALEDRLNIPAAKAFTYVGIFTVVVATIGIVFSRRFSSKQI